MLSAKAPIPVMLNTFSCTKTPLPVITKGVHFTTDPLPVMLRTKAVQQLPSL